MGIVLWTGCAALVFGTARFVSHGRAPGWIGELLGALASAGLFGLLATWLDFGGWNEPDWRAGLFVFFGSATFVGVMRMLRLLTRRAGEERRIGTGNTLTPKASPFDGSPTPHSQHSPLPQKQ